MSEAKNRPTLPTIVLGPDEGRHYAMPVMHAVFKADSTETGDRYCVSDGGSSRTATARGRTATRPTTRFSTS